MAQFLRTGRYQAAEADDRITAGQIITAGGPEVKAAGRIGLEGPRGYIRYFIETEQFKARQRDQEAATHAATVSRYVAEASQYAANAQKDAADAGHAAAIARQAQAEAEAYARQASQAAALAAGYAADAQASALQAKASADQAAAAAQRAREAAASAQRAAQSATRSASEANASAAQARGYAAAAQSSAARARASAIEAGKDAVLAAQAAIEAMQIAVRKQREEEQARLAAEMVVTDPDADKDPYDPTTPSDNGAFGSKTPPWNEPTALLEMRAQLWTTMQGVCVLTTQACALWKHYYNASGDDFTVNVDDYLRDSQFKSAVDRDVAELLATAGSRCAGSGRSSCTYNIDSMWRGVSMTENLDYRLGVRGVQYRVNGSITVSMVNGVPRTAGSYEVDVYKDWNFDADEEIWGISFSDYAAMHTYGVAQEFTVKGTSSTQSLG